MLVLDESGSIDATEFGQEKAFAYSIANSFNFGPTATQMGVVMFATNARVAVALDPQQDGRTQRHQTASRSSAAAPTSPQASRSRRAPSTLTAVPASRTSSCS